MGAGLYIVTEDEGKAVGIREGWNGGNWLKNTRRLDAACQASLLFISINPPDILRFSPFVISRPRGGGLRECRRSYRPFLLHSRPKGSLCHAPAQASFCIFRAGMTGCVFAVCTYTCEENEGLQREYSFAAGFPIGARSIPVGTRFCSAKSSVLYLCFRLARKRGWRRTLRGGRVWRQTLFRGRRTGGFCDIKVTQMQDF